MKCELCDSDGGTPIWRDERCRVVHVQEPGYAGYCRVIWNAHVKEMTDLTEAERAHCMRVVFALESVLRERLRPDKVNLASLGNMTPHLHWHVVARFRDDPHFPNAVWSPACRAPETVENAHADFIAGLAATLSRL
jgi:diadenosine tetraphosphate (Ap4A) HIT family hydrolase